MAFKDNQRETVYNRTGGKCHICHKKLAFKNYGQHGERGAWEIDHSRPRARGGSNHGNNLFAACISCNRSKQAGSSRQARLAAGYRRSPLSPQAKEKSKFWAAIQGAGVFGFAGARIAGPSGALIGGIFGLLVGLEEEPNCSAN